MEINIDPNLFRLGPFLIGWHGLFTAIAVAVGVWLSARLSRGTEITEDQVYSAALWCVVGGIVGARLLFVIEKANVFAADPLAALAIHEGGLSIYGGILGGTLAGVLYARFKGMSVGRLADIAAPGLILGQAIGRIGDVINGEHHGIPTDLPIGVVYTHPNTLGEIGVRVHLTVGYEMLMDLLILALLLRLWGRMKGNGMIYLTYASLYSFGRFFLSFLRVDEIIAFGLRQAQIVSILVLLVTIPLFIYLSTRPKKEPKAVRKPRRA